MKESEDIKDEKEPKATDDTKQQSSGESDEGVSVSEEYQKQAYAVTKSATKHHLNHLRSKISDREDELREQEMSKISKKGKDSAPEVYDASGGY